MANPLLHLNSTVNGTQGRVSTAALPNGDGFVAVWQDDSSGAVQVKGRFFDAAGVAKGDEFLIGAVGAASPGALADPSLAVLSDGRCVVAWAANGIADDPGWSVRARAFSLDAASGTGTLLGQEIPVNATTALNQCSPHVAALSNGGFVVSFTSGHSGNDDILARIFDSNLTPVGTEIPVNTATDGVQGPSVVAGWGTGYAVFYTDDGKNTIFGRILALDGSEVKAEFELPETGAAILPDVTVLANGKYLVTRQTTGIVQKIKGQLFNPDGSKIGGEFALGDDTGLAYRPVVAALPGGGFTLTYGKIASIGTYAIHVAVFNDDLTRRNPIDMKVGELTTADPNLNWLESPSVSVLANDKLLVSWTNPKAADDPGGGVYARVVNLDLSSNAAPADLLLDKTSIAEGQTGTNIVVGNLSTDDDDEYVTFQLYNPMLKLWTSQYSVFKIVGSQLVVGSGTWVNYETGKSHSIKLRVVDNGGKTLEKDFVITVEDVPEAPTDLALSAQTVKEKAQSGTKVGDLSAKDEDAGDSLTYALINDADGRFVIGPDGQSVIVADDTKLDFETATSHKIAVRVSDKTGHVVFREFEITVENVPEAPSGLALSAQTVKELAATGTKVGDLSAIDQDTGDTLAFTLVDDADGRFALGADGKSIVVADGSRLDDNVAKTHTITVKVADQTGLFLEKDFVITVTGDPAPPAGLTLMGATVKELAATGTKVGNLSAVDPDMGDTLAYTLLDNAGGRFALGADGKSVVVADGSRLDYEQLRSHTVRVKVTDSTGLTEEKSFAIALGNVVKEVTRGTSGNDVFIGGAGTDKLGGGGGNDRLNGGIGNDYLTGGAGKDVFVFSAKPSATLNRDAITDFRSGTDRIWLDDKVFAKIGKGTPSSPKKLAAKYFTLGDKARDGDDRLVYDKAKGALYYDPDGAGAAKAVLFAKLKAGSALKYSDLFVI